MERTRPGWLAEDRSRRVAAYAAGTVASRGLVLAAGTGAIAAIVDAGRLERRSGGHGCLVGDEGSGVWLGIEGVRAVLMALDGRGPATAMAVPICEGLGVAPSEGAALAAEIVKATYGRPPAQLGQLAPAVVAAADAGDEVASRTVDTAADHLTALAIAVAGAEDPATIVLAGSLLTKAVTISRTVSTRLGARWPSANVAIASSGEAGAAALAISARAATSVDDTVLDRLLGGARQQ